ncbi:MAG: hypothetical protein RIG82_12585 [Phycisphaeraceae bacterium]
MTINIWVYLEMLEKVKARVFRFDLIDHKNKRHKMGRSGFDSFGKHMETITPGVELI